MPESHTIELPSAQPLQSIKELPSLSIAQKVSAELLATYMFVLIGCGSEFMEQRHSIPRIGVAASWGLSLTAMIYTFGHVTGAHFNPAVSIAFATIGQIPWRHVPLYIAGQVLGSIIASANLRWLFSGDRLDAMLTLPASSVNDLNVIAWEMIATFIMLYVKCGVAVDERAARMFSGVAVGAALFLDVILFGEITGGSMNPARSIGPAIVVPNFNKIWIYLFAPVIGGVLASLLYKLIHLPRIPQQHVPLAAVSNYPNAIYSGESYDIQLSS